mmetsp:Transcript_21127/g.58564  ORF Transcript_21127/g.58564 Transcript_21127/m.58564 type:complete len:223 (-) Transcript_21127:24-692(-)
MRPRTASAAPPASSDPPRAPPAPILLAKLAPAPRPTPPSAPRAPMMARPPACATPLPKAEGTAPAHTQPATGMVPPAIVHHGAQLPAPPVPESSAAASPARCSRAAMRSTQSSAGPAGQPAPPLASCAPAHLRSGAGVGTVTRKAAWRLHRRRSAWPRGGRGGAAPGPESHPGAAAAWAAQPSRPSDAPPPPIEGTRCAIRARTGKRLTARWGALRSHILWK